MLKTYKMTEEQLETILKACKPTPIMYISGGQRIGGTPQENANSAWAKLGREMGFQFMTVEQLQGGTPRQFMAEPVVK